MILKYINYKAKKSDLYAKQIVSYCPYLINASNFNLLIKDNILKFNPINFLQHIPINSTNFIFIETYLKELMNYHERDSLSYSGLIETNYMATTTSILFGNIRYLSEVFSLFNTFIEKPILNRVFVDLFYSFLKSKKLSIKEKHKLIHFIVEHHTLFNQVNEMNSKIIRELFTQLSPTFITSVGKDKLISLSYHLDHYSFIKFILGLFKLKQYDSADNCLKNILVDNNTILKEIVNDKHALFILLSLFIYLCKSNEFKELASLSKYTNEELCFNNVLDS